jgi:hypothetical protein
VAAEAGAQLQQPRQEAVVAAAVRVVVPVVEAQLQQEAVVGVVVADVAAQPRRVRPLRRRPLILQCSRLQLLPTGPSIRRRLQ